MPRPLKRFWPLALALAIGLVARLLWLSAHSVLLDEATVAIGARDIVQNHTPMWEAMSNAPFVWMIARLLGMAGLANVFLLRLPPALIGAASIAAIYWLARQLFDEKIAVASAFLLALHPFAVAFSRVLFADPFQVFFVLLGCYGFDRLAIKPWRGNSSRWPLLAYLCSIWALAFLMKYNAIVPGALWLVSGVISRRYRLLPAFVGFLVMALGAFLTLLLWPYDEPIWLLAFMGKAGSYGLTQAARYFAFKLHLVFFGITEIALVTGIIVAWVLRRKRGGADTSLPNKRSSNALLHVTLFLLLEIVLLIALGRSFERYLLVIVPFGCMLLAALFRIAWEHIDSGFRWRGIAMRLAIVIVTGIFVFGAVQSYSNYFAYLRNDVDYADLAQTVLAQETADSSRHAFWLVPEPIAAYYLGYTQRYSRAIRPNLDGPTAYQNYFEFAGVPYADTWKGDKVLSIRRLAREWGLVHIFTSPHRFMESAKRAADSARMLPRLPVVEYLASDFVGPRDLLIMQSGFIDLQGEPILENIEHEDGPPFIPTLPLARFAVAKVYRPEGLAANTDTMLDRVRAGAWLLTRK